MNLNELCLKDRLILAREAERMSAAYFRELARRLDPRDERVVRLLEDAALDEEEHEQMVREYGLQTASRGPLRMTPAILGTLLKNYLPTLTHRKAGAITPSRAVAILHAVEWESVRLYRWLEAIASDEGARSFFRTMRERETAHAGIA